MKKIVLFSMLGWLLFSCSNQELAENSELMNTDSLGSSFMSVRIVSTGTSGTRVAPDAVYQDGEDYENYVSKVRFFFFYDDVDGTAAKIFKKGDEKVSYYDWNVEEEENQGNGKDPETTVEKILEKTLQFRVDVGETMPARVLAVLNPTAKVLALTTPSLKQLQEIVEDYEDFDEANGKKRAPTSMDDIKNGYGGFVMSNSVYADENNNLVNTTDCKDKFYKSAEEAQKNVLTIYVERVLARIDLSVNIAKGAKPIMAEDGSVLYYIYATGQKLPEDAISQDETAAVDDNTVKDIDGDIYVRFLGWNVFDTPSSSRLIKEIDITNWNEKIKDLFGWGGEMAWNSSYKKRSYWAINPLGVEYRTGPYMSGKAEAENNDDHFYTWTINNNPMPTLEGKVTDYFQENASPSENHTTLPATPSKVVLAAQLVDSNGKPQTLAKWGGKTYTVIGLKNEFAKSLNMWKRAYEAGDHGETKTTYTHIGVDDLDFVENGDAYMLTVTLKNAQGPWYEQSETDDETFTSISNPQAIVTEQFGEGNVKIWTKGYAYFYFTIRHLGETPENVGYYGVVRNHIYDATVTSIAGIGVPVYDPEKVIIETAPTEEDWYLTADVKILQWRVVKQSYDLPW